MFSATLRPSPLLATWIIAWGVLVSVPIWVSALPWWLCLAIDAGVLAWLQWALRHHYYGVGERQLRYRDGIWTLVKNKELLEVELNGEFYLSQWLIVLVFRTGTGNKEVVVILPDSIETEGMRRLRVVLKQLPMPETAS